MGSAHQDAWRGFRGSPWRETIDVGQFIHDNLEPYQGGPDFLAGPTPRTERIWRQLSRMFAEERRRGVYDVDSHTPSTITSHAPGYLDKDHELIVGLQTSAPLRRAGQRRRRRRHRGRRAHRRTGRGAALPPTRRPQVRRTRPAVPAVRHAAAQHRDAAPGAGAVPRARAHRPLTAPVGG